MPTPDGGAARLTLAEFATRHGLALTRFAYLLCGERSRAEDLVQEVYLALHRRFGGGLPLDDPLAYARRALVNANISQARRGSSRELPAELLPERGGYLDPAPDDELWHLLTQLGQRQRAVLVLRYYLGYADAEIAELLGCRRATVRSLAARALSRLREQLDDTQQRHDDGRAGQHGATQRHDGRTR
ncbi:MAG TPA: SigE family RNA polymerase sigma factor [Jatrophihabitans sp.]|nr:SigE family RNA polymerase sigma factor [Jatrophihabitans sp.]